MNTILRNTHKLENINLLKARDYYFNLAKRWNLLKNILIILSPALLMLSYLPLDVSISTVINNIRDVFVGCLSVFVFVSVHFIDRRISGLAKVSNELREEYDQKVLNLRKNTFSHNSEELSAYTITSKEVPYYYKYEVWYSEIFSSNHYCNVLCAQLDNILYSFYVYSATKRVYYGLLALLACVVLAMIAISESSSSIILIILASFECFKTLVEKTHYLNEGIDLCDNLTKTAMALSIEELDAHDVFCLQQGVLENRKASIFIPRLIRKYYLKEGSPFYEELNKVKKKFMGNDATFPKSAEDIEVMSEDGSAYTPLSEIQKRLKKMFLAVKEVLDRENIPYTLDGGTLLGAVRQQKPGFLFWDDDVDLAIPIDYVQKAKTAIQNSLPYMIQDAEREEFYSPRLSSFRIREPNSWSIVGEKDSPLYQEYTSRGLFIDVYTYSPILYSVTIDKIYRHFLIHPLNRRIFATEKNYYKRKSCANAKRRFLYQKKQYLKRIEWYTAHAKNKSKYIYTPNYIDNLSEAGPYHDAADLYGVSRQIEWENINCAAPSDPEQVLENCYGKEWVKSPFISQEELEREHGDAWFSKNLFMVTALKHISHATIEDVDS